MRVSSAGACEVVDSRVCCVCVRARGRERERENTSARKRTHLSPFLNVFRRLASFRNETSRHYEGWLELEEEEEGPRTEARRLRRARGRHVRDPAPTTRIRRTKGTPPTSRYSFAEKEDPARQRDVQGGGNGRAPSKPAVQRNRTGTIPTYENPMTRPGIEHRSPNAAGRIVDSQLSLLVVDFLPEPEIQVVKGNPLSDEVSLFSKEKKNSYVSALRGSFQDKKTVFNFWSSWVLRQRSRYLIKTGSVTGKAARKLIRTQLRYSSRIRRQTTAQSLDVGIRGVTEAGVLPFLQHVPGATLQDNARVQRQGLTSKADTASSLLHVVSRCHLLTDPPDFREKIRRLLVLRNTRAHVHFRCSTILTVTHSSLRVNLFAETLPIEYAWDMATRQLTPGSRCGKLEQPIRSRPRFPRASRAGKLSTRQYFVLAERADSDIFQKSAVTQVHKSSAEPRSARAGSKTFLYDAAFASPSRGYFVFYKRRAVAKHTVTLARAKTSHRPRRFSDLLTFSCAAHRAATALSAATSLLASHEGEPGSIPGRATPDLRMWESCQVMPLAGGFFSVSPAPSFRRCSVPTSITLIGSQDLAVKSRPNLFTQSNFSVGKEIIPRGCFDDIDVIRQEGIGTALFLFYLLTPHVEQVVGLTKEPEKLIEEPEKLIEEPEELTEEPEVPEDPEELTKEPEELTEEPEKLTEEPEELTEEPEVPEDPEELTKEPEELTEEPEVPEELTKEPEKLTEEPEELTEEPEVPDDPEELTKEPEELTEEPEVPEVPEDPEELTKEPEELTEEPELPEDPEELTKEPEELTEEPEELTEDTALFAQNKRGAVHHSPGLLDDSGGLEAGGVKRYLACAHADSLAGLSSLCTILVGGFSRGSPVCPVPSFRRHSIFTSITFIGSQDLFFTTIDLKAVHDQRNSGHQAKCLDNNSEMSVTFDLLATFAASDNRWSPSANGFARRGEGEKFAVLSRGEWTVAATAPGAVLRRRERSKAVGSKTLHGVCHLHRVWVFGGTVGYEERTMFLYALNTSTPLPRRRVRDRRGWLGGGAEKGALAPPLFSQQGVALVGLGRGELENTDVKQPLIRRRPAIHASPAKCRHLTRSDSFWGSGRIQTQARGTPNIYAKHTAISPRGVINYNDQQKYTWPLWGKGP
ncbi:hypothetical protein PR048_021169 [Dryococelus australis]|uniref:Uncharacterized protein n=1 Tax=Dryococelus australis TaxID=614101 RepID=A0ABQ9GXH2_9NEOP|nr:hypothetical protein PR048_021169 [Dryococelus australis]